MARKPIKNTYLRLGRDRRLSLSAPLAAPLEDLTAFAQKNVARFAQAIANLDRNERLRLDRNRAHVLDAPFAVKYATGPRAGVTEVGRTLYVTMPVLRREQAELLVQRHLVEKAKAYIPALVGQWSQRMGLRVKRIDFGWSSAKWASCRAEEGSLFFSGQLMGYSPETVAYVVVHELCHLRHPNHGPSFWAMVERYCPDYRSLRKRLGHERF